MKTIYIVAICVPIVYGNMQSTVMHPKILKFDNKPEAIDAVVNAHKISHCAATLDSIQCLPERKYKIKKKEKYYFYEEDTIQNKANGRQN